MLDDLCLLSSKDKRLFAADCAERVLPIFERRYPKEYRLREAIKTSRAFAYGNVSAHDIHHARLDLWDLAARYRAADALSAATAAACAASPYDTATGGYDAVWSAAVNAVRAVKAATRRDAGDAAQAERAWQEERLRWYLDPDRGFDWRAFGRARLGAPTLGAWGVS